MVDKIGIHWFRLDLRLNDNPSLIYLNKQVDKIIPLFVYDENIELGEASKCWLEKSLEILHKELRKLDSKLYIFKGDPKKIINKIILENNISSVSWNRLYDKHSIERDKDIKSSLIKNSIDCSSFNGYLLSEPWEIKNKSGSFFKVFTPFWKTNFETLSKILVSSSSKKYNFYNKDISSVLKVDELKLNTPKKVWMNKILSYWKIGESAAKAKLQKFINNKLFNYGTGRDRPDTDFTSKLSPHLHFGEISPKTIFTEVMKSNIDDDNKKKFLSEIGWRDFSYNLLYNYPEMTELPIQSKFLKFPWLKDKKNLMNWKNGETGIPIVDAGMKELYEMGWMHNRVRMITASFLVKDLLIDWRLGRKWFEETLFDHDIANNSAGWQWVAGSGTDAAPYFRIFNPSLQSDRFDKDGIYIKKWVPELRDLPSKFIHSPWKLSALDLKKYNIELGKTYPCPMIDHSEARDRALMLYKKLK